MKFVISDSLSKDKEMKLKIGEREKEVQVLKEQLEAALKGLEERMEKERGHAIEIENWRQRERE